MTIGGLVAGLEAGTTTGVELVEEALDRIAAVDGEGSRAFLSVAGDRARALAGAYDTARAAGASVPPFAGIPFAVKDLCDVEGEVTGAGSKVLSDREPAEVSAPALARVERAGFVVIGRTNMTEFAFSGLGLNSHFPAPAAPWDRQTRRIPGGSSSGTAVAVADGMAVAGLGTDTGGSCRIPAAFCGVVGFKPTARRVPLDGIIPLATSLDSVGPLARSVACCATVDDVFAGGDGRMPLEPRSPATIRLAALSDVVLDSMDTVVADAYEAALDALQAAGVVVEAVAFPELNDLASINANGGLAAAEAFHWHRELLSSRGDDYDQRIRTRIETGAAISAADYLDVVQARQHMIATAARRLAGYDAFVMPTVAVVPPPISSLETTTDASGADAGLSEAYLATNRLCLRNTSIGNFLDACSISLPISGAGAPVGLMLMGGPMHDRALLALAAGIERLL